MTKQEHTPTPWKLSGDKDTIFGKNNADICFLPDTNNEYEASEIKETREANAAYIVRCVNSHDALVNALQYCLEAANAHEAKELHSGKLHEIVQEKCRLALAAAKGEA